MTLDLPNYAFNTEKISRENVAPKPNKHIDISVYPKYLLFQSQQMMFIHSYALEYL